MNYTNEKALSNYVFYCDATNSITIIKLVFNETH